MFLSSFSQAFSFTKSVIISQVTGKLCGTFHNLSCYPAFLSDVKLVFSPVLFNGSTAFLIGPKRQVTMMLDPARIYATAIYIASMIIALFSALYVSCILVVVSLPFFFFLKIKNKFQCMEYIFRLSNNISWGFNLIFH